MSWTRVQSGTDSYPVGMTMLNDRLYSWTGRKLWEHDASTFLAVAAVNKKSLSVEPFTWVARHRVPRRDRRTSMTFEEDY